jgi:hypothetical protein
LRYDHEFVSREMTVLSVRSKAQTLHIATISASAKRGKISDKTRPQSSRNSVVFRFFVRVLRRVRKWIRFKPFFAPANGDREQEKRGIDSQRIVTAATYAESR